MGNQMLYYPNGHFMGAQNNMSGVGDDNDYMQSMGHQYPTHLGLMQSQQNQFGQYLPMGQAGNAMHPKQFPNFGQFQQQSMLDPSKPMGQGNF
mmetsp:Transcript_6157/g.10456  ORF Transcript_6157/g.10456 Transcript_6157/m.10456 type:complete len:93 (+) Transcript_6157:1468-1746(+)